MTVGSMFTGYGGLDLAVGGQLLWYSENDPAACSVLAAHYEGLVNLGDVTTVNWETVTTVDVITAGYPCQPFSQAGKRKGSNDERHLWPYVRDAIGVLRPRRAVLENVAGHLSLGLGEVLGDLAALGYDARWGVVRASDAGAPHRRERVFIVAADAQDQLGEGKPDGFRKGAGREEWLQEPLRGVFGHAADADSSAGPQRDERESQSRQSTQRRVDTERPDSCGTYWGEYEPAIRRWECTLRRSAPPPTIRRGDRDRLNPVFVEWMMGLPEGWVTGRGLSATQELRMLGNGVVPQQAALALGLLT